MIGLVLTYVLELKYKGICYIYIGKSTDLRLLLPYKFLFSIEETCFSKLQA